jgi:hypothetical protein
MNHSLFASAADQSPSESRSLLDPALRSLRDCWEKVSEFLDAPRSATPGIVRHVPDHWLRPVSDRDLLSS